MIPWLSPSGRAVLIVAAMVALAGVWLETAGLLLVAECVLAAVAWFYLRAIVRADEVERGRIAVRIEPSEGASSEARVGDEVRLDVVLEHRGAWWLPHARLAVSSPSGLRWPSSSLSFGAIAPGSVVRATVPVRALRSGRWVLPGVELTSTDSVGWVRVSSWMPADCTIVARPGRGERLRATAGGRRRSAERLPAGRHRVDRPGDGYDIRQLRTYVVGDDTRKIAWKASARRGRLMVRQHEDEVSETVVFVLDASGSMRGGTDGKKWETALTLVADATAEVARHRDRVGLVSFDHERIGALPPREGGAQPRWIVDHLVALGTPVAPERTEENEAEVARRVTDYLILQERVDFRRSAGRSEPVNEFAPADELFDTGALERWARDVFAEPLRRRDAALEQAGLVRASLSMPRRLADLFGIELTPRVDERFGRKTSGLVEALEHVAAHAKRGTRVVIVSDLLGIESTEALHDTLRKVVASGHHVSAWTPFTPAFVAPPEGEGRAIAGLFAREESRDRRRVAEHWQKKGIPVLFVGVNESVAQLWKRTTVHRRRGR